MGLILVIVLVLAAVPVIYNGLISKRNHVISFNNAIQMASSSILAGMLRLTLQPLFAAAEVEHCTVDVHSMFAGGL